jgi:transposase
MDNTQHSKTKLYMAMELSAKDWKLRFTGGDKIRGRSVPAGQWEKLVEEINVAKKKLGLPADAPVVSCQEAGRDGNWIHRMLEKNGVRDYVVDSSSIEVSRQKRRAKTDKLDAESLLRMLLRYEGGEKAVWSVNHVPTEEQESERLPHRELERLMKERTSLTNRIKGELFLHNIRADSLEGLNPGELRDWEGKPLPPAVVEALGRELDRLALFNAQIKTIKKAFVEKLGVSEKVVDRKIRTLMRIKGIGVQTAWVLVMEFFWRDFKNRREVGSAAGLTGTPYNSGQSRKDQGISKAGNRRIRALMIETAWAWLRFQPDSDLAKWFGEKYAKGSKAIRKIGVTAVARKLLVALWKWLERDEPPAGAVMRLAKAGG